MKTLSTLTVSKAYTGNEGEYLQKLIKGRCFLNRHRKFLIVLNFEQTKIDCGINFLKAMRQKLPLKHNNLKRELAYNLQAITLQLCRAEMRNPFC